MNTQKIAILTIFTYQYQTSRSPFPFNVYDNCFINFLCDYNISCVTQAVNASNLVRGNFVRLI